MSAISFDGQVAVVTGSGRGLGRAYALALAQLGASIVVNDIRGVGTSERAGADDVVNEIEEAGGHAVASYDSVSTSDGCQAIIECARVAFGAVDAVVHNAGFLREGYFEDLTVEQWLDVLGVHLNGAFFLAKAAWPIMLEKGYGRIVLVGSSAGLWGRIACANYCAAKAGVWGLCRGLALDGASRGIFTNYLMPAGGPTIGLEGGVPARATTWAEERMRGVELPNERLEPRWVAPMAAYLASSACTVNGEAFSAIYGRYARVFTAVVPGWVSRGDEIPLPAEIAAHLTEIEQQQGYIVPDDVFDEVRALEAKLNANSR